MTRRTRYQLQDCRFCLELNQREHNSDNGKESVSRYVLADLAKGCYALGCLALDILVVFQLYDWLPTLPVAIFCVFLIIVLSVLQTITYKFLKSRLSKEPLF
jgi:hypothetical protein